MDAFEVSILDEINTTSFSDVINWNEMENVSFFTTKQTCIKRRRRSLVDVTSFKIQCSKAKERRNGERKNDQELVDLSRTFMNLLDVLMPMFTLKTIRYYRNSEHH